MYNPFQFLRHSPVKIKSAFCTLRPHEPFATARRHLYTLLLFTYTDYKTIFIPIAVFSAVAAPVYSLTNFLQALVWIWFHLLQCNVSNQYKTSKEDVVNRPWRPIPSGRITSTEALMLRIWLVPVCLVISSIHSPGVVISSAGLTVTTLVYDELRLAGHWMGKNICAVSGYLTFEIGATKIMGKTSRLDTIALHAMLCSAFVILTTVHAQDFPDVAGDAKIGRITFPIHAPKLSRLFTLFAMVTWSAVLGTYWALGNFSRTFFFALGALIGWRYYRLRTPEEDSRSYLIYNVWLFMAHLLPCHARWRVLAI